MFPNISSRTKKNSAYISFDKQVSRNKYHDTFIAKQEEHKVEANGYNAKFDLTRKRTKVALFDPAAKSKLIQSVNLTIGTKKFDR